MPTVWVYRLRVVKRKTRAKMIPIRMTMRIGVGMGMPGIKLPMAFRMGLSRVGVAPPLIQ